MILHHTLPRPQDLRTLPQFLGLFNCLYLSQFLTDFCQILDSKSYDQSKQNYMIPPLAQRLVSRLGTQPQCLSQSILNRFLLNFGIYILTKCMEIIQAIMQIIMQTILQANVQPFMQAIIQIIKKRAVHILASEIFWSILSFTRLIASMNISRE